MRYALCMEMCTEMRSNKHQQHKTLMFAFSRLPRTYLPTCVIPTWSMDGEVYMPVETYIRVSSRSRQLTKSAETFQSACCCILTFLNMDGQRHPGALAEADGSSPPPPSWQLRNSITSLFVFFSPLIASLYRPASRQPLITAF